MKTGLILCSRMVIPSLFPFMVISELIVKSGLGNIIGNILGYPIEKVFGISRSSSCAVLMGILCGFPIGAKTIVSLLDNQEIDEKEASQLLTFCNNPSSGFIISAIGVSLYSNKKIGIILYIITIVNAILIGIIQNYLSPPNHAAHNHKSKKLLPITSIFTTAVINSSYGIIYVCGYVVFFSAIIGCLSRMLSPLKLSDITLSLIYGFLELSGGVSLSANLGITTLGLCLTAFIIGWSGLSVHFQVISVCSKYNILFKNYFIAKFFHAIMNSVSIFILFKSFPSIFKSSIESTVSLHVTNNKYIIFIFVLFVFSIFHSKKTNKNCHIL